MDKHIFILNGTARAGKDTFAKLLGQYIPTKHISSISPVKRAAISLGWNGEKTNEYRKFLCEFKKFLNNQGNFIWDYLDIEVDIFRKDDTAKVLLIDIREPEEIKKAVERYNAKTILIIRDPYAMDADYLPYSFAYSNSSDQNVYKYEYDFIIENHGSIADFRQIADQFVREHINSHILPLEGKIVAVDFDNTIAKTKFPEIIEPISETIDFLRKAKENGAKIILWTCREGSDLCRAVEWCRTNQVPIDFVNENDPSRIKLFGNNSRKISADLYIDDKSFSLWHDRRGSKDLINWLSGEVFK